MRPIKTQSGYLWQQLERPKLTEAVWKGRTGEVGWGPPVRTHCAVLSLTCFRHLGLGGVLSTHRKEK